VNYTWLQAMGTRQTFAGVPVVVALLDFIPRSGNAGLSYTYGRWDARVQVNYHSNFCENVQQANPRLRNSFRGARFQWDFNGGCGLARRLSIFANVSNFTSQDKLDYYGWVALECRDQIIGYSFIVTDGISAQF
jgi:hypothetical protein